MDTRYRTYGKLVNGELPHRIGRGKGESDIITVGKLDNSVTGAYKIPTKDFETLKDFHYKKDGIEFSTKNYFRKVGNSLDTKARILDSDFEAELEVTNMEEILATWKANHGDEPPVFEISNEPNLFPYMSPVLYAYHYTRWWNYIKNYAPNARIMNGGLFITDKLPDSIKKSMRYFGIPYISTFDYYMQFVNVITKINYKYIPDILNLHIYPYVHTGGDESIDSHVKHMEFVIRQLEGYYKEVWLTEFGNINPKNMAYTYNMTTKMLDLLDETNIKRWYYFKMSGSDSTLELLQEVGKKYYKTILIIWYIINIFLRIPMLMPFSYVCNKILKIFKLPDVKGIAELVKLVADYIKQVPIQSLQDPNGVLNIIGRMYVSRGLK